MHLLPNLASILRHQRRSIDSISTFLDRFPFHRAAQLAHNNARAVLQARMSHACFNRTGRLSKVLNEPFTISCRPRYGDAMVIFLLFPLLWCHHE